MTLSIAIMLKNIGYFLPFISNSILQI
jgi:hypothetical protein